MVIAGHQKPEFILPDIFFFIDNRYFSFLHLPHFSHHLGQQPHRTADLLHKREFNEQKQKPEGHRNPDHLQHIRKDSHHQITLRAVLQQDPSRFFIVFNRNTAVSPVNLQITVSAVLFHDCRQHRVQLLRIQIQGIVLRLIRRVIKHFLLIQDCKVCRNITSLAHMIHLLFQSAKIQIHI